MNETQQEFTLAGAGIAQSNLILQHLVRNYDEWVPMTDLVRISGAYAVHSRIAELRKRGHSIDNRVERSIKPYHSWYRLNSVE